MQLEQLIGKQIQTKLEYVGTIPGYCKIGNPIPERQVRVLQSGNMYCAYDVLTQEKIWESEQEIIICTIGNYCGYLTNLVKSITGLTQYVRISDGYKFTLDSRAYCIYLKGDLVIYFIENRRWISNIITNKSMQTALTIGSAFCNFISETIEDRKSWLVCGISGENLIEISDSSYPHHSHGDMLFVIKKLPSGTDNVYDANYATDVYRIIRTEMCLTKES
jgi:hypothetical protein